MPTDRPFPWLCPSCLNKTVEEAVIDYYAEVKYCNKLVSFPIHGLKIPRCMVCREMLFTNSVCDQIQAALQVYLQERGIA